MLVFFGVDTRLFTLALLSAIVFTLDIVSSPFSFPRLYFPSSIISPTRFWSVFLFLITLSNLLVPPCTYFLSLQSLVEAVSTFAFSSELRFFENGLLMGSTAPLWIALSID